MSPSEWISPNDKMPEKGQRVEVLVIKELIYMGNGDQSSSDWMYDGNGEHVIIQWKKINDM